MDPSLLLLLLLLLYFIPSFIAAVKHSARSGAIFAVNLLLGWTVIGWFVAFVWALGVDRNTDQSRMKKCPECAELVQPDAAVCRFCHHSFATQLVPAAILNKERALDTDANEKENLQKVKAEGAV